MNILITGAAGFVGKNLAAALQNVKDGKDKTHPSLEIGEIYLYDIDSSAELLEEACEKADFVFNLAGVNRPKDEKEFKKIDCYWQAEPNIEIITDMCIKRTKEYLKEKKAEKKNG